jgi:hypothetical protein
MRPVESTATHIIEDGQAIPTSVPSGSTSLENQVGSELDGSFVAIT